MSNKIIKNDGEEKLQATLKFLKQTKRGVFTEIPPAQVSIARISDLREIDYEKTACCFSFTG